MSLSGHSVRDLLKVSVVTINGWVLGADRFQFGSGTPVPADNGAVSCIRVFGLPSLWLRR